MKMSPLQRLLLGIIGCFALMLAFVAGGRASISQLQRDQISIPIIVNVTPAPVGYRENRDGSRGIAARFALRARGSQAFVDAALPAGGGELVAQVQQQQSVRVQAEVSPNPNATLLYPTAPTGVPIVLNGTAGTTVTASCAYNVTVHTTVVSWTLRQGLSANFSSGFPGTDLNNDSYVSGGTPQPNATPFIVYPTAWTVLASSGNIKTYCVDLSVTIPVSLPGGSYSTNAIYTLYY